MDNIPKNQIKSRNVIEQREHQDDAAARRVILIDEFGNPFNDTNPLPAQAVINGNVTITLDGFDFNTPGSLLATGSETGAMVGTKHAMRVDPALDVRVGISNGANKAIVSALGELSVADADTRAALATIITQLAGTITVDDPNAQALLTSILTALGSVQLAEPVKISGTIDGTPTGTEITFVNNRKQQILAAHDRDQIITYADFGTKNQRITNIDYVSPTIGTGPGFTARKNLVYVLDGSRYRRTNITWSLV